MYILDTNIWLERLLNQRNAEDVGHMLDLLPVTDIAITEFGWNSICIILTRMKKTDILLDFVDDLFVSAHVRIIRLLPTDISHVLKRMEAWHLDYDDAYHYYAAEKEDCQLISLDSDYDPTPNGRLTPLDVIKSLQAH